MTLLQICACGPPAQPTHADVDKTVDFTFTLDGEPHRLAELRGRPVVLVLMRTSELVSQMYMREVTEAFRLRAGEIRFLVLTVEPSEAPFIEPYVESEELPFPIGVSAPDLARGETALGAPCCAERQRRKGRVGGLRRDRLGAGRQRNRTASQATRGGRAAPTPRAGGEAPPGPPESPGPASSADRAAGSRRRAKLCDDNYNCPLTTTRNAH